MKTVAWWSGGVTSAIACKIAIDKYDAIPVFIETGSHHKDSVRFKSDCEKWYKVKILELQSNFDDHYHVIEKMRYVNGPAGARCTSVLKRNVREKWEKNKNIKNYIWGFEYSNHELKRSQRMKDNNEKFKHIFPLIDEKLTKIDCIKILNKEGIEIPTMYKLGFQNNNCIGCVKGGMSYWNLIRKHFPDDFKKMAELERKIGRSCIKKYFLDELPENAGRDKPPLVDECGATGEGCTTALSKEIYNFD